MAWFTRSPVRKLRKLQKEFQGLEASETGLASTNSQNAIHLYGNGDKREAVNYEARAAVHETNASLYRTARHLIVRAIDDYNTARMQARGAELSDELMRITGSFAESIVRNQTQLLANIRILKERSSANLAAAQVLAGEVQQDISGLTAQEERDLERRIQIKIGIQPTTRQVQQQAPAYAPQAQPQSQPTYQGERVRQR